MTDLQEARILGRMIKLERKINQVGSLLVSTAMIVGLAALVVFSDKWTIGEPWKGIAFAAGFVLIFYSVVVARRPFDTVTVIDDAPPY